MRHKSFAEIRDFYHSTSFFDQRFDEVVSPLLKSFVYQKGVPLDLEEPLDYYTSTTATALLALHHMRLLDNGLRIKFHETLFWLRDHTVNRIVKEKSAEDKVAWDVSESASVWATSLALWGLLGTRYNGKNLSELISATLWLADQQKGDGGWGFDRESPSRIYFTGLALHALQLGMRSLPLSNSEKERIKRIKQFGLQFVLHNYEKRGKLVYWKTNINQKEKPDPTSTLYEIWALSEEQSSEHDEILKKSIQFLREELKGETWELRKFIEETKTKYGTQKIVMSYTPSFLILLLRLGIHPFDEICLKPLIWLKENKIKNGWSLPGHSAHALSFTTAYALWAITQWHRYALQQIIKNAKVRPFSLRKYKRRISILVGIVLVIGVTYLITSTRLLNLANYFFSKIIESYGIIGLVGFIASLITILGLIRWLDLHVFDSKITKVLKLIRNTVGHFIYGK